MRFDWDPDKAEKNLAKHSVRFEDAMFTFFDPFGRIELDVEHSEDEDRYWQIGMTPAGLVVVVYTIRQPGNIYRIITARKATRKERQRYENFKRI
jgi:uncharacterized DUF497 family protein